MKEYNVKIKVGDSISVGRFRNVKTKIKSIELDKDNQPIIITSKGSRKLLNFKLESKPTSSKPAKMLME
jgi:hypothetical protein